MFGNLDDPQKQLMLMLGAGLLSPVRNKGFAGFGEAFGQGIQGGLLAHNQARQMQDRRGQMDLQRKVQEMQLAEFQRGQDFNKALGAGFQPGVRPATPVDDNGYPMPSSAPQMDFSRAMQIDPLKGMQAQASWQQMNAKAGPQFKEVGGRLVRIDGGNVSEAYAPPEKPAFQKGQTREIKAGRQIITQEWDGSGWKQISRSMMDKPESDKGPAAPTGYRWNGDRLEPIPGGPQDTKVGKEAEAAAARDKAAAGSAEFVLSQVRKARDQAKKGWFATGATGKIMRNVGGTDAFDLNSTVDSIKANIGFDTLAEMRRNSPTGGALGQVAVQELNMLQAARGALDTAQSEEQFLQALDGIEKHYTGWLNAVEQSKKPSGGATGGWSIQRVN